MFYLPPLDVLRSSGLFSCILRFRFGERLEVEFAYGGCRVEKSSEANDTIGELILYEGKVNTFAITKVSFCSLHPASLATTNFNTVTHSIVRKVETF